MKLFLDLMVAIPKVISNCTIQWWLAQRLALHSHLLSEHHGTGNSTVFIPANMQGEWVGFVCRKPPLMRFKLDFGKAFGGSMIAKPIRLWLDPFIRETLTNMIVWPNRIVVPMLPEEATGSLDHLYLR